MTLRLPLLALAVSCAGAPSTDAPDTDETATDGVDTGPFFGPDVDCGPRVTPAPGTLARWPYLQQVSPTSVTVMWGTAQGEAATTLEWGYDGDYGTVVTPGAPTAIDVLDPPMDLHRVDVGALIAGTGACYRIKVGDTVVASGLSWRTAPASPRAHVRFVAIGDMGNGSEAQAAVRDAIAALDERIDFWVTAGDNAYNAGRHQEFQDNVFAVYQDLWTDVPVLPVPGNHDWGDDEDFGGVGTLTPYLQDFAVPPHGMPGDAPGDYYALDYGPVHWTALDSHLQLGTSPTTASPLSRLSYDVPGDDMLDWASDDATRVGDRWHIVGWHHPAYSGQPDRSPEPQVSLQLRPWVEAHDVDLVINGHNHLYERFGHLRDGAKVATGGTTWVVTGGGGAGLYELGDDALRDAGARAHHFLLVDVTACTLSARAIGTDGVMIDSFELSRCDEAG
ncbi:MAG: metallophosphoesterase [Alphaproteobacteria bacterium]|nr:metallophosphoesterase [Alphaproteobacteria bacterium]